MILSTSDGSINGLSPGILIIVSASYFFAAAKWRDTRSAVLPLYGNILTSHSFVILLMLLYDSSWSGIATIISSINLHRFTRSIKCQSIGLPQMGSSILPGSRVEFDLACIMQTFFLIFWQPPLRK